MENETETEARGGCGCFGCLSIIITVIIIWALIFGVTIGGKHYGIKSCDFENGVVIDH